MVVLRDWMVRARSNRQILERRLANKPPSIFRIQSSNLFQCNSGACPRICEMVMNRRKAHGRNSSADPNAVKSLTLQKPIIERFDTVCIGGRNAKQGMYTKF